MLAFWQLWSVKESAYKAWQRLNRVEPVFNPKRFMCSAIQRNSVCIENGEFLCKVKTIYTNDYIYSQCDSKHLDYKIFTSPASFKVWKKELYKQNWIFIKSKFNIPSLYNTSLFKTIPVSITNDMEFIAMACRKGTLNELLL